MLCVVYGEHVDQYYNGLRSLLSYNYERNFSTPLDFASKEIKLFFICLNERKISYQQYVEGLFLLSYEISSIFFVEDEYAKCLQRLYRIANI